MTSSQLEERCARWVPHDITFQIEGSHTNPYLDVDASVLFTLPSGRKKRIPAFWSGGQTWRARFAPSSVGRYSYRVRVTGNRITPHPEGKLEVVPYTGRNALYRHGPIKVDASRRYLCHQDGEPFFWLADTWWYGATSRCRWPEDFQFLVQDRAGKGFTVIQMVVGIPPEIAATDPEAANEGGLPFLGGWDRMNPDYFDYVDRRVACLVNAGLVPCIVGGWGHHIDWAGKRAVTHFWEYLVARYAAYPVVWCLSGETDLFPGLGVRPLARAVSALVPPRIRGSRAWAALRDRLAPATQAVHAQALRERRQQWEQVGQALSAADPSHHPVTTHPAPGGYAHETVNNAPWLDLTSIQSGHSEQVAHQMVNAILEARHLAPQRPIINMEPWYEGILGRFWGERQRYAFWMCVLAGAAGHTYGANGVWQMSTSSDDFLGHWGEADWRAAYALAGSSQLGAARAFLGALRWWELQPRIDWITPHWGKEREDMPLAAAAGTDLVLVYFPATRRSFDAVLRNLEAGREYQASWFNTRSGAILGARSLTAEERWVVPARPSLDDWLLAVEKA
jgi:hypothetical protein